MKCVQIGRLVTPIATTARTSFSVIVDIQDKNFVITQSPLTMQRERVAINTVKLLDCVIPIAIKDTAFDVQRCIDSSGAVRDFEQSEDYKKCDREGRFRAANDFERFVIEMKERVEMDVLKEKNLI